MLTHDDAMRLCERVLELAGGDADVSLSSTSHALLRIGESQPIQHGHNERVQLGLRLRLDGRYGEASVDGLDDGDIGRLVAEAREQAALLPPPRELWPSIGPQEMLAVLAYHADTSPARFDADARAAAAAALCAAARREGLQAAGVVESSESFSAMATSGGMRGSYASTSATMSLTVHTGDSSGWRQAWSRSVAALDPATLGDEATEVALRARAPQPLEPGLYRAVLSPAAAATLLHFLAGPLNARSVGEGRSYAAGKLGQPLFGERIHLTQNVCHPGLQDKPFDGDGCAVEVVELLCGGAPANLLHDRKTAREAGCEPTGYSPGGRLVAGAFPTSLCLRGGDASEEELIAACGDGLYITKFHYTNWLDESACSITGMTRDGTFRIRDGQLAEPTHNARVALSLPELLSAVELLGVAQVQSGCVAPALLTGALRVSSATLF